MITLPLRGRDPLKNAEKYFLATPLYYSYTPMVKYNTMVKTTTPEEGILNPESTRNPLTIATHNGVFHADDVFAVAALMLAYPNAAVVRTRDPQVLAEADIVVDVGGEYNLTTRRFDHHQKGGAGIRYNGVPYAAFGLVWDANGIHVVTRDILFPSETAAQRVVDVIDASLVQAIDASDNGFVMPGDVRNTPSYSVSQVISSMNPTWQDTTSFDEAFLHAVEIAGGILTRAIRNAVAEVAAEAEVAEALDEASMGIVVLEKYVPWTDALLRLDGGRTKFILFPAETGDWRIQAVPDAPGSFGMRYALPEAWAGLRDAALVEKTGVPDAIFCHSGRFIAGAQTREGVAALALLALQAHQS